MRLDDGAIVANTTLVDKEDDEDEVVLDENGNPIVIEAQGEEVSEAQNIDTPPAQNEVSPEE